MRNFRKARVKRKAKGRPPSSVLKPRFNSIKIIPVAVDSSDDDDDENESEKRHKEKKKANEKTLCMVCCTPKRPDLVRNAKYYLQKFIFICINVSFFFAMGAMKHGILFVLLHSCGLYLMAIGFAQYVNIRHSLKS